MAFQVRIICVLSLLIARFYSCVNFPDTPICFGAINEVIYGTRCITSNGYSGNCLPLWQCGYAMGFVNTYGVRSMVVQFFLHSNQCGYAASFPMVCCFQAQGPLRDTYTGGQQDYPNQFATYQNPQLPNQQIQQNPQLPNQQIDQNPQLSNQQIYQVPPRTVQQTYQNHASLLPRDCGLAESDRIIGGELTELDEFPWMALLEYQEVRTAQTDLLCGGTLISHRYVLTAAHCIANVPSSMRLRNVRLGEYDTRTDPDCISGACADPVVSVPIEKVIVHESYGQPYRGRNDIALLRLAYKVPFTTWISPICLPFAVGTSSFYWSAGWGGTGSARSSNAKLKVKLSAADFHECVASYRDLKLNVGEGQMCAGGATGKDTCKGDSGGPLMKQAQAPSGSHRWVIEGIVSLGFSPCGTSGWPGIYTKVYDYVQWITKHLEP